MTTFYTNNPSRNVGCKTTHNPNLAQLIYYAILKRWTGLAWVKALLKVYDGIGFNPKPLKIWSGASWEEIDTTGI